MPEYHNVSVRLTNEEYKKLSYLHEVYNSVSVGKVSLADVLRKAVNELHASESLEQDKKDN